MKYRLAIKEPTGCPSKLFPLNFGWTITGLSKLITILGVIKVEIIIHSASADASADLSADMPENRLIKLKIILKHSRML